jgi:hypothetical protein
VKSMFSAAGSAARRDMTAVPRSIRGVAFSDGADSADSVLVGVRSRQVPATRSDEFVDRVGPYDPGA